MKKLSSVFSILMILAFMMALVPTGSVFAAKDPGSVVLIIHNNTGKPVNFDLMEPNGGPHHEMTLLAGITKLTLDAGWHDYFASTPCGNKAGVFNLNVSKELYLTCGAGDDVNLYNYARRAIPWFCPITAPKNGQPSLERWSCCTLQPGRFPGRNC